jgi:hypothetical protein
LGIVRNLEPGPASAGFFFFLRIGEKPVQNPTKYGLLINMKTAKALGLAVPLSLLGTADEVPQDALGHGSRPAHHAGAAASPQARQPQIEFRASPAGIRLSS